MWEAARLYTDEGRRTYTVKFDLEYAPHVKVALLYWDKNGQSNNKSTPQYWYPSAAEAKAACEIHAATGAFPPSVELNCLMLSIERMMTKGSARNRYYENDVHL